MLEVLISATHGFCQYIKEDLPRLPSPDGKRIGTQPISSHQERIAWQVHAFKRYSAGEVKYTDVIAVEARSRYCILFSNPEFESLDAFSEAFRQQWAIDCVHMAMESGATTEDQERAMYDQFLETPMQPLFVKNTDLSVNGHVADAEQWMLSGYEQFGKPVFNEEEEREVARHINLPRKKAKPFPGARVKESFLPMSRMVDDWLFRFAKGLSQWQYPNTPAGNFPDPFPEPVMKQSASFKEAGQPVAYAHRPNNVVSLDEVRRKKSVAPKSGV